MMRLLFVLQLVVVCTSVRLSVCAGDVLKVHLHPGVYGDRLIFYFSQSSRITYDKGSQTFDIPCGNITDEVRELLRPLRTVKRPWYTMKVTYSASRGIRVAVRGTSPTFHLSYAYFTAIGSQRGVVIHLTHGTNDAQQVPHQNLPAQAPVVVIDYGHGGSDDGAIGYAGIKEKDITRQIGNRLVTLLKKNGITVRTTRKKDETVSLDERTRIANNAPQAALLVSLHANSSQSRTVSGIETFCAHPSLLSYPADQPYTGFGVALCSEKSCTCAQVVHRALMQTIRQHDATVIDRTVKRAISQLLLGAEIPAILIELGFVTHRQESRLLQSPRYQDALAQGIAQGIITYLRK